MIKLHDAEENFDFWVNENQIVSIEYAFSKNGTELFLQNGMTFQVTETPEQILALMGETTQPAPVKNNTTNRLEDVDGVEIPNSHRWIRGH